MNDDLSVRASALSEQLVRWRRHLHANPELSGEEAETARFVAAELQRMGLSPAERVDGTYGVLAEIPAGRGPAVALRADMDALPIQEETGLDFASRRPGVMHACGHDAHTAMLLGAAALLVERRDQLRRPVRLIFQPHEEKFPGGATAMIRGGALANVERIFGIHISSDLPLGIVGLRPGPMMAGVDDLSIEVAGRGGHAAMPEQCVDPILAASQFVTTLQSIVSRALSVEETAVVSVTRIEGGTANNVIPDVVRLGGTIRTFDPAVRERTHARLRSIADGVAAASGAVIRVDIQPGYPVLVNDSRIAAEVFEAARRVGFAEGALQTIGRIGGGEDFAYYLQQRPGAFAFLGARNPAKGCEYPHHHAKFNVDEDALPRGAALLAQFALDAGREE